MNDVFKLRFRKEKERVIFEPEILFDLLEELDNSCAQLLLLSNMSPLRAFYQEASGIVAVDGEDIVRELKSVLLEK